MNLCSSFLLGLLSVAQQDLSTLRHSTSPTTGVLAALSEDGERLWHARGPVVLPIDLGRVRRWELADVPNPKLERASGREHSIEASVTSMLDIDGTLYVGGGDTGLFRIDRDGKRSTLDTESEGRWCFDLAVDASRTNLFAIWGARDTSQIRIYDLKSGQRTASIDLDVASGLPRVGIGYAVAARGDYLYAAMGSAGVVRVRYRNGPPVLKPGPDLLPPGTGIRREELAPYRVRDLTVQGSWLFAAAEGSGLVELDLGRDSEWGSKTAMRKHRLPGHFPLRVQALVDPDTGRQLVAIGTAPDPSAAHEWGPYYSYGGFSPSLAAPAVDRQLYTQGCDTGLFVFERNSSNALTQVMWSPTEGGPAERSWKSLSFQKANGRFWVYDNEFTVWNFWRVGSGWSGIRQSEPRKYSQTSISYTSGFVSKLDPTLILCASDAGREVPQYRVQGSPEAPQLTAIPRTELSQFQLGLLLNSSWVSPHTGREWFAFGTGGNYWKFIEFFSSMDKPELLASPFGTWNQFYLTYPSDPQLEELSGRSYSVAAIDDRPQSELIATSRTQTPTPVTLYYRSEIEKAALRLRGAGKRTGHENPMAVTPAAHLAIHPELSSTLLESDITRVHTLNMHFFDWQSSYGTRRILGIAAGANANSDRSDPYSAHPKLAFVDVTDCDRPGSPCSAALIDPALGPDPATLCLAYGARPGALLWDFAVATLGDRQFAFSCDTSGSVLAFDLSELFRSHSLREIARWQSKPSSLDGFIPPMSAIKLRREQQSDSDRLDTFLYIAANRRGVIKLRVEALNNGNIRFEHIKTINTPGQAAGLLIDSFPLGENSDTDLMLVFDHEDGGIKLFTE